MKWVSVNNGTSNDYFELWDNDKKLVSMSLSKRTKIARIESSSDKRLFFLEKKGFFHGKTVIKNEYGIKLGELHGENWEAREGVIELDGTKYFYAFPNSSDGELIIYRDTKDKPLVSCSLSSLFGGITALVEKSKSLHDTKYPSLLMGLCWYLLNESVKEVMKETAA